MTKDSSTTPVLYAKARARSNIALAKYWGKIDPELNLPAVPSISITLDPMVTETSVAFTETIKKDLFILDGRPASAAELRRVIEVVDTVRTQRNISLPVRIESRNSFPTASGLASSASGFAALVAAVVKAAGLPIELSELSVLARRCSASAARSIYGGFVELAVGIEGDDVLASRQLAPPEHWGELRMIVAVTAEDRKKITSTTGMNLTREQSPYYEAWRKTAPLLANQIRQSILDKDLSTLGSAMEKSALAMHACAMAASSRLIYWQPATVAALHRVRQLREEEGMEVWATVDAGPHVKALCHVKDAPAVEKQMAQVPGVMRTIAAKPGPGVELL